MKKIKWIITGILSLLFIYGIVFAKFVFINESTGYIQYGYTGFYHLLKNDNEQWFYWKEYVKYDLNGIDKVHLLYKDDQIRLISVDKNNELTDKLLDSIKSVNIVSANSQKEFTVPIVKDYQTEPAIYQTKNNIFVISDIEGNFDMFTQILKENGVINNDFEWTYGKGHLVLLGDYFDRGNNVTAVLWLCYKLEHNAEKQGGKVHYIIGNHEQMNLLGNMKYVRGKYKALAQKLDIPYKKLYGKNSEIGRWLRSKNGVEIINNLLFVHGGISPELTKKEVSLTEMNQKIRQTLNNNFKDYDTNPEGPLWYRGYFRNWGDYKKATQAQVAHICKYYNINKIIVGHTLVDSIKFHYNERIIGIDVLRNNEIGKNKASALLINNGEFFAVDELGRKFSVE